MDPTPLEATLLDRYLAGESTRSEYEAVERWMAGRPDAEAMIQTLRQLDRDVPNEPYPNGLRDLRATIEGRIEALRQQTRSRGGQSILRRGGEDPRRRYHGWWLGGLGVVLGAAILAILAYPSHPIASGATQHYATRDHQEAAIALRDGSHVILGPHSTLRVHDFASGTRSIDVEGEAYVTVARASNTPFIVNTGTTHTQVLGTAFMVRYTPDDRHLRVSVADGRVRVIPSSRGNVGVVLSAGEIGDVRDSTVHVEADGLISGAELVHGTLRFRDTPLSTILATLTRWYGYQFRYADSTLGQRTLNVSVSTQSSIKALAAIERVMGMDVSIIGDTVTLVPQTEHPKTTPRLHYDEFTPNREVGR